MAALKLDRSVFSAAGRAFLRAFGASLLVLAPGVLAAPNLNGALVLATSALLASVAAGLRALQALVPTLTVGGTYGSLVTEFVRVAAAGLITLLIGVLAAPSLHDAKAIFTTGLVALASMLLQGFQNKVVPPPEPS